MGGACTVVTAAGGTVEGVCELAGGPELAGGWQPRCSEDKGTVRAPGRVAWPMTDVPITVVPSLLYTGTEMFLSSEALSQAKASAGECTASRPDARLRSLASPMPAGAIAPSRRRR